MNKKFVASILAVLLALPATVFAAPQPEDTVLTTYDGSAALILANNTAEFEVATETAYYSIQDSYYHFTGANQAGIALNSVSGASYINLTNSYSRSDSIVYALEFDFMLGNTDTQFAVRERGYLNTGETYSGNATPANPVTAIGVGSVLGSTTIAQNRWYRLAVVFDMTKDTTTTCQVYLNGENVTDGIGQKLQGYGLQWIRIQPLLGADKTLDLSIDNLSVYQTVSNYTAGETATVSSNDLSVATIDGSVITVDAGVTEEQLRGALNVTEGAAVTMLGVLDPISGGTIAVRSKDGIYTYYEVIIPNSPDVIYRNSGADPQTLTATNEETVCINTAAPQYTDNSQALYIADTVTVGDGKDYFSSVLGDKNYLVRFDALLENSNTAFGFRMRRASHDGNLGFDVFGVSASSKTGTGVVAVTPKRWNRYAAVFNNNTDGTYSYTVYLNGEQKSSGSLTADRFSEFRAQIYAAATGASGVYLKNIGVYAYDEAFTYTVPEDPAVTAVSAEVGALDAENRIIMMQEFVDAGTLCGALTLTTDARAWVIDSGGRVVEGMTGNGCYVVVTNADEIFAYYLLQDNSYVNFDFDYNTPTMYGNCGVFETVLDEERGGKVLHMTWDASQETSSAYFRVSDLEITGSYIISYALKSGGNNSMVFQSWGANDSGLINTINSLSADGTWVYGTSLNGGNRPGEWIQYATFVDTDAQTATMYINGVQAGEPISLDDMAVRYLPEGENNYLRFFLRYGSSDEIYLDDFRIYPAQSADGLTAWDCCLRAAEGSGVTITALPAAMGRIEGAAGKKAAEIPGLFTMTDGTEIEVLSDGTAVDGSTVIADGMTLKATLKGASSLYRFTSDAGSWASTAYADNTLTVYADAFGADIIIGHYKDENGIPILEKVTLKTQVAGYTCLTEELAEGTEYMQAFLWDSISGMSQCAEVVSTKEMQ